MRVFYFPLSSLSRGSKQSKVDHRPSGRVNIKFISYCLCFRAAHLHIEIVLLGPFFFCIIFVSPNSKRAAATASAFSSQPRKAVDGLVYGAQPGELLKYLQVHALADVREWVSSCFVLPNYLGKTVGEEEDLGERQNYEKYQIHLQWSPIHLSSSPNNYLLPKIVWLNCETEMIFRIILLGHREEGIFYGQKIEIGAADNNK